MPGARAFRAPVAALAVLGLAAVLCVTLLPHDSVGPTVLVNVPSAGNLGGNVLPSEAFNPRDYRNGKGMAPGSRKTPAKVDEIEDTVNAQVDDMEEQVAALKKVLGTGTVVSIRMGSEVKDHPGRGPVIIIRLAVL